MNDPVSPRTPKILIVRFGSLGDIVHALPAMQELHRIHPEAEIHWLAEEPYRPLLETVPHLHRVWTSRMKKWRKQLRGIGCYRDLVRRLRAEKFDLVYDFQGLIKSAATAWLAGGKETIGFERELLREKAARIFYSRPTALEPGQRHQVEYALDLVRPPRFQGRSSAAIGFRYPAECLDYVDRELRKAGIESPPVLLNPGAAWETKRWDIGRFAKLGELISGAGYPVIYTIGPGEEQLLEEARRLSALPVRSFPTSMVQLSALCSRSLLMVGGDTGPLHLAVASGTPAVALIGPAHAWRTGPFHPDDEVVSHERPCPHPYSRTCKDHFCMDIPVERVFAAVVRRIAGINRARDCSS